MANRILYIVIFFSLLATTSLTAQVEQKKWSDQKIKGTRQIPYSAYSGSPFLNDKFADGQIEFLDGTKLDNIGLRYSSYRDEVIYYNATISAQIIIDKISLKGFSFTDEKGDKRTFRHQYYNGFFPGERYFEVLSDGDTSLLVYRKVTLQTCPLYNDNSGVLRNMSYQEAYNYYIYNEKKGYELIRINKNSLLSKFDKPTQKLVKKLLRRNSLSVRDESGFVRAWNLIKENGIKINF
ncbi:MAG TPA: hypothetical protein VGK38_04225 [Prolixibacteraceae bacterium]